MPIVVPQSYVSADATDLDSMTLNMMLTRAAGPLTATGVLRVTKKHWQHTQIMTDHFWLRFINSYLPNLQICQKWALLLLALCFTHYSTCDCQGMNVGVNEQVELLQVTYTTLYQNAPCIFTSTYKDS